MARNSEQTSHKTNIIENGTVLKGEINAKGALRVDGEIEGTIVCDGKLVIGEKGKVSGQVNCVSAEIMGKMEGKLKVEQLLSISATAQVDGEISTAKLSIEANAIFTGTCNMGSAAPKAIPTK